MSITIVLRKQTFSLEDNLTVQQALDQLGFTPESYLVLVDGRLAELDELLASNAQVELIPTIAGG
ncbi:MAG: hypothetical protein FD147_2068 [Chloroflexi bacterium]|nr:MAG: hypothetical protein FD147_2068 [Chloroflexota bacterium]MBA4376854.1 thiamine biosynthesis protein ThiS [Anaerolinea sp.]